MNSSFGGDINICWDIEKFRKKLWGAKFTVFSYSSDLRKLFESETNVLNMVHI